MIKNRLKKIPRKQTQKNLLEYQKYEEELSRNSNILKTI